MPKTTLVTLAITVLAVLEFFIFGMLVGSARQRYGVKAPAISGHEIFDRYFRVHMNTLELLIVFLPLLWIAGLYTIVAYYWLALIGALFLIGRVMYLRGYVADPAKRGLGYGLSALPTLALFVIDIVGIILMWIHS
jgi:glutathione S-transferase